MHAGFHFVLERRAIVASVPWRVCAKYGVFGHGFFRLLKMAVIRALRATVDSGPFFFSMSLR